MIFITSDKTRGGFGISLQEQLKNELKELEEAYQKEKSQVPNKELVGGFKYFLFSPLPGEMIQFD